MGRHASPEVQHDTLSVDVTPHRAVTLHVDRWELPSPRVIVVVAHGAGEHGRRYDALARTLVDAGCSVVTFDNLGHGRTGLSDLGLGELGPGGNRAAARALIELLGHTRATHPGVPLVLFGHSWGSLLAQRALASRADLIDGLVLSGTTLALPGWMNPGDLNGRWRADDPTGFEWLSRDPAERASFAADDLCWDIAVTPVWSIMGALPLLHAPPMAAAARIDDVPVLILSGSEDSLGYGVRGPRALARAYRRRTGLSDVTHRVFDGARHAVMGETNRVEVETAMTDWIRARFPA